MKTSRQLKMVFRGSFDASSGHGARLVRLGVWMGAGVFSGARLMAAKAGATPVGATAADGWGTLGATTLMLGLVGAWLWERRARRRTEGRLRSANDRLRALFDESPLSICVFDPNDRDVPFRIVECNQYACDLHGWTREELIGRGLATLTPLELTYEGAQHFLSRLRTGTCRGENPHKRKDGTVFFIEYVARLVVIDGREYMIGVDRDLSAERARRASEEQLNRTAELNQLVLRASKDGVWDWDILQDRITFSNRSREMLGYSANELPDHGPLWNSLLHPDDWDMHGELLRRHWEEDVPYVYQFRARHKDGTWRWIISRGITLFDGERRPIRMVGCRTDITELKRIDAELLQGRKLRAVGEMVGGIAHEFNNLLTPMLLHAEMLDLDGARSHPTLAAHTQQIRVGINRARELTQRILTFGRRSVEAREIVGLETVARENIAFLAQTIDRRIQIVISPSVTSTVVFANRSDLNQLVVNLVLNARDALVEKAEKTPPAGWVPQIEISLGSAMRPSGATRDQHAPKRWHRLTVCDNGQGMSDDVRERVFEPFFTTKEVGRGTGLGLATVWHVSAALGGWIEVESTAGEGAAFHVFLPPAPQDAGLSEAPGSRPPVPALPLQAATRMRVLLVEDNEIVAYATQRMIMSFGHYVELVRNGQAAWEMLSERPDGYEMVFTDLNLPGIHGVELVRRLRNAGYVGRLVVYSGYFSREHETTLVALNVEHLLPKPFSRAQLGAMLA